MAMLAHGIVGGEMAWPLIVVGILMGIALIMIEVKSPMLFAVGMYLPLETTFAIFLGGMIRWVTDKMRDSKNFNDAQKARVEECRGADRFRIYCGRGVNGNRHRHLQIQAMAIAGNLRASERDLRIHRTGDLGNRDDPRAAGERRQPGRAGSADRDHVGRRAAERSLEGRTSSALFLLWRLFVVMNCHPTHCELSSRPQAGCLCPPEWRGPAVRMPRYDFYLA